jgi:hypothetical protein
MLSRQNAHLVLIIVLAIAAAIGRASLERLNATQPSANASRPLTVRHDAANNTISVFRSAGRTAVLTEHVGAQTRPYIHPFTAPDGTIITGPNGLFWAFTNLNGRDYFHNSGSGYWRRVSVEVTQPAGDEVRWQTVYDLLDQSGVPVLTETARWSMRETNGALALNLEWRGRAHAEVTIGRSATQDAAAPSTGDNAGLFLSLASRDTKLGDIVNAARQRNERAAGQRAMWIDAALQRQGRSEPAHITIFDYPDNPGYPQTWRIDRQAGIAAVRSPIRSPPSSILQVGSSRGAARKFNQSSSARNMTLGQRSYSWLFLLLFIRESPAQVGTSPIAVRKSNFYSMHTLLCRSANVFARKKLFLRIR